MQSKYERRADYEGIAHRHLDSLLKAIKKRTNQLPYVKRRTDPILNNLYLDADRVAGRVLATDPVEFDNEGGDGIADAKTVGIMYNALRRK